MTGEDRPVVLVVEDETTVAEMFATWLEGAYEARVATTGTEALEAVDGVDVVLLDRRMPGLSGDETLERLREAGYGGPVAMVTAVDPDFDIVDMPFDDYLVKPVTEEELLGTVERLESLSGYDEQAQEHFAIARKLAALEVQKTDAELEQSSEYTTLREHFERMRGELDTKLAEMDERTSRAVLRRLQGDSG